MNYHDTGGQGNHLFYLSDGESDRVAGIIPPDVVEDGTGVGEPVAYELIVDPYDHATQEVEVAGRVQVVENGEALKRARVEPVEASKDTRETVANWLSEEHGLDIGQESVNFRRGDGTEDGSLAETSGSTV